MECDRLAGCGFFKKYQATKDLACKGFTAAYCKGPQMDRCRRKDHLLKHGTPPPDDMMPSGQMIALH